MNGKGVTKEEKIAVKGMSDAILNQISVVPIAMQEQIINNVLGNWLIYIADIKKVSLRNQFDLFTSTLNDEILTGFELLSKSRRAGSWVEIERKDRG